MGFRYRRSFKIAPGLKVNLNKKSASMTFGTKGIKYTISTTGRTRATISAPGTGLSYTASSKGGTKKRTQAQDAKKLQSAFALETHPSSLKSKAATLFLCFFFGMFGVHRYYVGKIGTGVLWTLTAGMFVIGWIVDIYNIANNRFCDSNGYVIRSEALKKKMMTQQMKGVPENIGKDEA